MRIESFISLVRKQ